ncbi:MAG: hypothetical protein AAGG01_02735 [Planctomycetota bacterium]
MSLMPLAALLAALTQSSNEVPTLPSGFDLSAVKAGLLIDEPGDGRTWARAETWKASFGADGLSFIPFLGSDVPRNYPVRMSLRSMSLGGEQVPFSHAVRSRIDRTVSVDRGIAREVYHLTETHVEQTFVFDLLPAQGDLVLELEVETELRAEESDGGFLFSNEYGGVRYGSATAVDASGKTLALDQELSGATLRIVVPSAFITSEALPLVVDPVLETYSVTDDTRRQIDVDIAFSSQNTIQQIVYSELQSATDSDIIAVYYNVASTASAFSESIDITSANWSKPSNAYAYEEQQFLCVALEGLGIGNRSVIGRTRNVRTNTTSGPIDISGPGAEHVDVGGQGSAFPTNYDFMVVWQEADVFNMDFDIVARAVRSDGTSPTGRIVIDGDPTHLDRYPSISKSSGPPATTAAIAEYMLTWERELSDSNADIHCQVMEYTGTLAGHDQFRAYSFGEARRPDVSSWSAAYPVGPEDRYWGIVFERRTGANFDIFGIVAYDGDADNARSVQVMQDMDEGLNHRCPRITLDPNDFLVAYYTEEADGTYPLSYVTTNAVRDGNELRMGLAERREALTGSNLPPVVAVSSAWDGGTPFGSAEFGHSYMAWVSRPATSQSDVHAAIVSDQQPTVVGSQFCTANPNSTGEKAWIRAEGVPLIGSIDLLTLRCVQAPAASFGFFLCSQTSGFTANPGGSSGNLCLQGSIGRFVRPGEVLNSGTAGELRLPAINQSTFPSPAGDVAVMPGDTWYFTTWFRDVGPTSNFSNGVEVFFYP